MQAEQEAQRAKQLKWQHSMTEMRFYAARRKETALAAKLAQTNQAIAKKRWKVRFMLPFGSHCGCQELHTQVLAAISRAECC